MSGDIETIAPHGGTLVSRVIDRLLELGHLRTPRDA